MKQVLIGIICGVLCCVSCNKAYKRGYNKGVDDCTWLVKFGTEIQETTEKKRKKES